MGRWRCCLRGRWWGLWRMPRMRCMMGLCGSGGGVGGGRMRGGGFVGGGGGGGGVGGGREVVGTLEDAEDAVHDGFVRFWRRRGRAKDAAGLFYACVRTAAMDQRRGKVRRVKREEGRMQEAGWFEDARRVGEAASLCEEV